MQTLFNYSNTNKNRNTHCEQKTVTNNLSKENVKKNKQTINYLFCLSWGLFSFEENKHLSFSVTPSVL